MLGLVVAVTATLGLTLGRPTLFTAANSSAATSERGYHCHPHETAKQGNGNQGSCRPKHCC